MPGPAGPSTGEVSMRLTLKLLAITAIVIGVASGPTATRLVPGAAAPAFTSIGPLTFGADGVLFAADRQAATIFALDLGSQGSGATAGTGAVAKLDERIAGMLGTGVA